MVAPDYICNLSLMNGHVYLHGNLKLVGELEKIIKKECISAMDLYHAQEMIRNYCIKNYGSEFYHKSEEAIMFLVENEYCNLERQEIPYFDKERYEEDLRSGVMY